MQLHLVNDMAHDLDRILQAAKAVLDDAKISYHRGRLTPGQIESVFHLRNDLGELLARFGDGKGYGTATVQALWAMRGYEEIASGWLDAVIATSQAVPKDAWRRLRPGRYLVTRTRETASGTVCRRQECVNPAVATRRFDKLDGCKWDER